MNKFYDSRHISDPTALMAIKNISAEERRLNLPENKNEPIIHPIIPIVLPKRRPDEDKQEKWHVAWVNPAYR